MHRAAFILLVLGVLVIPWASASGYESETYFLMADVGLGVAPCSTPSSSRPACW